MRQTKERLPGIRNFRLAAALVALSCSSPEPAADIAAQMAGEQIPYAEFESYLAANAIVEAPSLDSKVLSSLFDQFLEERLLNRLAVDEGVQEGNPRLAVSRLVAASTAEVTRADVEAYYRANLDRFHQAERVRLSQILVEERADAEQAARELASGAPFEDVARRISSGPRADAGGDQGLLMRDDLPPKIADQVFALEPGEVSEIVPAAYGFHIFQISERYSEDIRSIDSAYPEIVEQLEEVRRAQTATDLLTRAVKRYNVRVFARNLPFQYLGKYG